MQRAFNGLGQLITEYQAHGGSVNTSTTPKVQYAYSEMASGANHSRLTSMTYPNGRVLTYSYGSGLNDSISRLNALTESSGSVTLESYTYMGLGTVVERKHPLPTSPASSLDLSYITSSTGDAGDNVGGLDRFGRIVDQKWTVGSTVKDDHTYTYDRNGNRLTKGDGVNSAFNETYTYDGLNQISTFAQGSSHTQSWGYDGLGNWTSLTTDGGTPVTRTANAQNEYTAVGSATPAYDANGNMTTDETGKHFVYDAWNRLVTVKNSSNATIASYTYDALTHRVTETASSTTTHLYYSAGWQVLEERLNSNTYADIQYVWSPVYVDAMVLRDRDSDHDSSHSLDERLWTLSDTSYNVNALLDSNGNIIERYAYDQSGSTHIMDAAYIPITSGSGRAWIYLFESSRISNITDLMHFRRRDYSPYYGRWTSNDPTGYLSGNANLYLAFDNNTLINNDPYGECASQVIQGQKAKCAKTYTIPKEAREYLDKSWDETLKDGLEHGGTLIKSDKGIFKLDPWTESGKGEIKPIVPKLNPGDNNSGTIHTHPDAQDKSDAGGPSQNDVANFVLDANFGEAMYVRSGKCIYIIVGNSDFKRKEFAKDVLGKMDRTAARIDLMKAYRAAYDKGMEKDAQGKIGSIANSVDMAIYAIAKTYNLCYYKVCKDSANAISNEAPLIAGN